MREISLLLRCPSAPFLPSHSFSDGSFVMACATVGKHIAPGCLPAGPWVFSWLKMQCSWDVPGFVAVQTGCCDHGELGRKTHSLQGADTGCCLAAAQAELGP